jgi:hypothetical protein
MVFYMKIEHCTHCGKPLGRSLHPGCTRGFCNKDCYWAHVSKPKSVPAEYRVCRRCNIRKPILEFYSQRYKSRKDPNLRYSSRLLFCDDCRNLKNRDNYLRRTYGISLAEYNEILSKQGGLCYICHRPPSGKRQASILYVDHCHSSGAVRRLLCKDCNTLLGCVRDDPAILRSAINYLIEYGKTLPKRALGT